MSPLVVFALVVLEAVLSVSASGEWGYTGSNGPKSWYKTYPNCAGQRQSPIDLHDCEPTNKPELTWSGYDDVPDSITLKNNGHSVVLTSEGVAPRITFDDGRIFQLNNVHFHWGKKDSEGSEHTIEKTRYTLEMHAVHMRVDNDGTPVTPTEAIVITALMKSSLFSTYNSLNVFIDNLDDVIKADTETSVDPFPWSELLYEFNSNFVWYEGSLTTPPCSEVVTFYIDGATQSVTKTQMEKFRKLLDSHDKNMSGNFRPLQKQNGRKIYCHN